MYLRSEEVDMGQQLSWLEHTTDNREVDGSSPFWPTTSQAKVRSKSEEVSYSLFTITYYLKYGGLAQLGERLPCKQEVTGSIPVLSTKQKRLIEAIRNCCFTEFLLKERDSNCTLKTEHCNYECNYEKATVKEKLLKFKG